MSLFGDIIDTVKPYAGVIGGALGGPMGAVAGSMLGGALGGNAQQAISGGLQATGGLLQTQQSAQAAKDAAARAAASGQQAYGAATFRPVGLTTNFGSSNFQYDPKTGQMISAGYTLDPRLKAQQDALFNMSQVNLNAAGNAPSQYAPLTQGATNMMNLGNSYVGQSPDQVAQDYMQKQQALLAPSREQAWANLSNQDYNRGTTGLKIAQGGGLNMASPYAAAIANAQSLQDLQLAANAQQAGQQNTLFGVNLLNQGANTLGNYYGGISNALSPYSSTMSGVSNLETMGQNPYSLSSNLGAQAAGAGARAGQLGLMGTGLQNSYLTGSAATTNPWSQLLGGTVGSTLGTGIGQWLSNAPAWTTGSDVIPQSTFSGSGDATWMSSPWM